MGSPYELKRIMFASSGNLAADNVGPILAVADWLNRNPSEAPTTGPPLTVHTVLVALVKAYEI